MSLFDQKRKLFCDTMAKNASSKQDELGESLSEAYDKTARTYEVYRGRPVTLYVIGSSLHGDNNKKRENFALNDLEKLHIRSKSIDLNGMPGVPHNEASKTSVTRFCRAKNTHLVSSYCLPCCT